MYRRVLVATGGSPWSDTAVTYAIALAASIDADLRLLSVLTGSVAYTMPDVMSSSELVLESIERQGHELLAQAAARAASVGVPYVTSLKWGNVPEVILHTAAEENCDVIVLGARQVTGFKRLMVGSTSNAVAAKSQQPVLVVKRPPPRREVASHLWRRLLVATGGSPWSDVAVDHALSLAQAHQLEVCLLHVDSARQRHADELLIATSGGKNILALAEARAAAAGVAYQAKLAYGNVVDAILETAANLQCDAIILGSRGLTGWKRLMLGSISNAVGAKADLPVLIVKRFLLP
jgi:nucleotide-binding universal stress UspA family protein